MYRVLHSHSFIVYNTIDAHNTIDDKNKQVDLFENLVVKQKDLSTHGTTQIRASLSRSGSGSRIIETRDPRIYGVF
jgi:hypothetical protein